ncbi:MAG: M20/M25/M40 family metallo-hydrolase [Candidatus Polarisedimenticolia bacterium]
MRIAALALVPLLPLFVAAGSADRTSSEARAIAEEALQAPTAWQRLRVLTDTVGARLAGSEAEPKAIAWAKAEMEKDGVAVRLEPVMVPVWRRGEEYAAIVTPSTQPLVILGLGGTVGTPREGITAPVVVVGSFDELKAMEPSKVTGRIVVYDVPWMRGGDEFKEYGTVVPYRGRGASEAAKLGAVGVLIRSVATSSLRSPHTGALRYADDAPRIPAAAASTEDAALLRRLFEAGHDVRVTMRLGATQEPDRPSSNVVGEIRGRERPDEIVLIGAHLDSWDVGTGAIDDGAGCAMVLEAMRLIAKRPPPRRTVRAVLFANEENGLRGGRAYRETHEAEMPKHVAALEADSGAARALGLSGRMGEGGVDLLRTMMTPALSVLGAVRFQEGHGGADLSPMGRHGVPRLNIDLESTKYFDWHHSMADTLDKVDPQELQQAAATLAAATWIFAEDERTLPRYEPTADELGRPAPASRP